MLPEAGAIGPLLAIASIRPHALNGRFRGEADIVRPWRGRARSWM